MAGSTNIVMESSDRVVEEVEECEAKKTPELMLHSNYWTAKFAGFLNFLKLGRTLAIFLTTF